MQEPEDGNTVGADPYMNPGRAVVRIGKMYHREPGVTRLRGGDGYLIP
jgi:hypothetical protein